MARHFPVLGQGRGSMRQIILALFALGFLLSSCAPTASAGTPSSTRTGGSGYRDSGLSKHTDQFTSKTVCEQSVTKLTGRHNLKITARLDERGVYTFSLIHHRVNDIVHPPFDDYGFLLRYPGVEVWSHGVADYDFGGDAEEYLYGHQIHTIIVNKAFYTRLLGAKTDLSYRLIDSDEARQDSLDGVITLQHIAPLRAFVAQCL